MKVHIVSGDISRIESDCLITAINSGGLWFGGIDGVIQRSAGNLFHQQAAAKMPLEDGQTIIATGKSKSASTFKNVVFVVDDLQQKLRVIVMKGLLAASEAGYKKVSLPTIRMGVMLGQVEKSAEEAIKEVYEGIELFLKSDPNTSVEEITFVVYHDPATQKLAEKYFSEWH